MVCAADQVQVRPCNWDRGPLIEQSVGIVGQSSATDGFGVPSETGAGVLDLRQLLCETRVLDPCASLNRSGCDNLTDL